MKAIAIILAAGESRRMGTPKALLEVEPGITFLACLARTFAEAGAAPLVVVGAHAAEIVAAHPALKAVVNEGWPAGQLSSARVGVRAALIQGAARILIHPVDAPLIATTTALRVLAHLALDSAVVPTWGGSPGHPLGLGARAATQVFRQELQTLEDAVAAVGPELLPVEDPAIVDNLNSPDAVRARLGRV